MGLHPFEADLGPEIGPFWVRVCVQRFLIGSTAGRSFARVAMLPFRPSRWARRPTLRQNWQIRSIGRAGGPGGYVCAKIGYLGLLAGPAPQEAAFKPKFAMFPFLGRPGSPGGHFCAKIVHVGLCAGPLAPEAIFWPNFVFWACCPARRPRRQF